MKSFGFSVPLQKDQKELLLGKEINGEGGFQSLLRKFQEQVVGDILWLNPKDVERVHRYRTKYGQGGFENRLMGIDFSSLKPANNEFPKE
jgi:hypothetical protein